MLVTLLFAATGIVYGIACALYLTFLARGAAGGDRWGRHTLGAAAGMHVCFLGADFALNGRSPVGTIDAMLSLASLLMVVAYLVALTRHRIAVLGAFITPVTLLFLLGSALGRSVSDVPTEVRSALLPFHITANILGIVAFALAFAVAIAYVVQEHQVKQKHLGGLFQRLPSLDVLDSLGLRLILLGFPLFTVGVVTGAIWAVRLDRSTALLSAAQGFAVLTWLVFGAVLLLRVAAGWRGRRAAIGTMIGFACTLLVLTGYVLRAVGGGA